MNFKEYNDHELIFMIGENSIEAKNILFEKYKYIIDIIIGKYANIVKILKVDWTDIYQEAYVGFSDALNNYREDKDSSLKTFISLCVERRVQTALKKAGRLKNKLMNESLSLEQTYDEYTGPLMDLIGDDNKNNPLLKLEEEEVVENLVARIKAVLSDSEYEVFALMINGLNYQEIATILDKEPKQIDNTIQRIRNKVRKIIN